MLGSLVAALFGWVARHRKLALIFIFALVLGAGALVAGIHLDPDLRMMLPLEDEGISSYYESLSKFRPMDSLFIDVGIASPDPSTLSEASDALYEGLTRVEGIREIAYRYDPDYARKTLGLVVTKGPNLFSEEDAGELEERIGEDQIRDRLTWFKRNLAGPQGAFLKKALQEDPIGFSNSLLTRLAPQMRVGSGGQLKDGRVTSSDGLHVLITAETDAPPADAKRGALLVQQVSELIRKVEEEFGVSVAFTGTHRSSADNVALIRADIQRTSIVAFVGCLILTLIFLRRWWLGIFVFIPVLFGGLVAGAALVMGYDRVSVIAVGCGTALVGITIDYGIHVLFHLDPWSSDGRGSETRKIEFLSTPIGIGVMTSVGAFLLLLLSPIPGYQQIGIFASVAVAAAAAFALIILPLLLPRMKGRENPLARAAVKTGARFFVWHRNRRIWVVAGAAVLTGVCWTGIGDMAFEGDPQKLNGMRPETRADERRIRETWGDFIGLTLVVSEAPEVEGALRRDERVGEVLRGLQAQGRVTSFSCISTLCPSRETQTENRRRWTAFWTEERRNQVRERLDRIAGGMGFRKGVFDEWVERLDREVSPLTLEDYDGTPLGNMIRSRVAESGEGVFLNAVVKLRDRGDAARLLDVLRGPSPGTVVVDARAVGDRITSLAKEGMTQYALLAGAVMILLLWLIYGRLELVLVSILPLGVVLLWTFGTLGLLGIPINMASSVFVVFLIGVGMDACQLMVAERLARFRGEEGHPGETAVSVALCALTTLAGFGALALSDHPVLRSIGVTTVIGMGYTLIAVPVFVPLLADFILTRDRSGGSPRLGELARFMVVGFCMATTQLFILLPLTLLLRIFMPGDPRRREDLVRGLNHRFVRMLVFSFVGSQLKVEGVGKDTFKGRVILVSNHESNLDSTLLQGMHPDILLTVKKRWWNSIVIGAVVRWVGHVRVDPESPEETLAQCRTALAREKLVHFFPEGTRSSDGRIKQFHRGAFKLAAELKCDILPVAICDSRKFLPPGAWWMEPAQVRVKVLPRITQDGEAGEAATGELLRKTKAVVSAAHAELLEGNNVPAVLRSKVERLYRYQGALVENYVHWKLLRDPMFAVIGEEVPRRGTITDLGCGYGVVAQYLLQQGRERRIVGVDYDERKVRIARSTLGDEEQLSFECRDIMEWEAPESDCVLLLDVLHYLEPEARRRLLSTVRDRLRPGGVLLIRDMFSGGDGEGGGNLFWEKFAIGIGFNRCRRSLEIASPTEMRSLLASSGFERIEEVAGGGKGNNLLLKAGR